MKRALLSILVLLLVLVAVMVGRTVSLHPAEHGHFPAPELEIDPKMVVNRLARAVRIPSVSAPQGDARAEGPLTEILAFLAESYPPVYSALTRKSHPRSIVFRWKGSDPSLAPLLLLAHLDVVPVDPETEDEWTHPPFSGEIAGGCVWGRGTLDDKSSALAILEAAQHLLGRGFVPRREVIIAFGLDEEIGGRDGARRLAGRLAAEGAAPAMVLDEGLTILDGLVPGVEAPVAAVGIAEKGAVVVELRVETGGGHASLPGSENAIPILAAAIDALEREPMPGAYDGATRLFFETLAPEMPFGPRMVFGNGWITFPLIEHELGRTPATDSLLRTTGAVTTIAGGVAPNALATEARATVNFRIHPRDSVAAVLQHVREVVDDERIEVSTLEVFDEPSPTSTIGDESWNWLERTIRECFEGVHVAPTLLPAATDARHFVGLSRNVYRFAPYRLAPDDLARIHGVDERIEIANYLEMIRFYVQLLRNA